jgi:carbonic anhydrase
VSESEEALRRTEQRAVMLSLERLMEYPMVRERLERGELSLDGWHYVIEEGKVLVLDIGRGQFIDAGQRLEEQANADVGEGSARNRNPGREL